MADDKASNWIPPVSFYFQVCFQRIGGPNFQASFLEVSGLSWDLGKRTYRGNDGNFQTVPTGLSYSNVTLKRPVGPLSHSLAEWLNECHNFMYATKKQKEMKAIMTYDVIIHLLNMEGKPHASWQCVNAYPMKWSMSNLASDDNKMATETIELAYARLERVN